MKKEREVISIELSAHNNSDLRLMELAERNPSLGGRELLREIIERGQMPEEIERPQARDIRAAFKTPTLDDPDYRTRIEHADWLGRESPTMRDLYEHGAEIKDDVFTIPAEEYELRDDRGAPFITTLSYAQKRIGNVGQAREFHSLALAISGQNADPKMQIAVFKNYYDRISHDERGNPFGRGREAERSATLQRTIEEMRVIAAEMEKLETRESIKAIKGEKIGESDQFDKEHESIGEPDGKGAGGQLNISARKVNLRDESLRFPAGLSYETRERLVSLTIPEIDRRLENGVRCESLFNAIDNTMFRRDSRDLTEWELEERSRIASFLKGYIDERMRDPETHALNTSAVFREARTAIINTTTSEALGRVASSILRLNEQRSEELRLHRKDPDRNPLPAVMPLNARERNLLFNGRAPEHHTREMRELRLNYGLSRAERTERIAGIKEGRLEPSEALRTMISELEARKTAKAVAHFQANILNEKMSSASQVYLYRLHQQIPPHERTYIFELSEERKKNLLRQPWNDRAENINPREKEEVQINGRGFGKAPRDSRSFREYMANMGRMERELLNEAVSRLTPQPDREKIDLTITEARNILPEKAREEIRLRARNLAWQSLVPEEVFERDPLPEAVLISDTISHIQEHLQDRARFAQTAHNDFVAEKLRLAEETSRAQKDGQMTTYPTREERDQLLQSVLETLPPDAARKLTELNHYAAETREEVYRGFEFLDAQLRALELAHTRKSPRSNETISFNLPTPEKLSADNPPKSQTAYPANLNHFAVAFQLEEQAGQKMEAEKMGFQKIYVQTDREWHFDSLKEILGAGLREAQNDSREREDWQHNR